MLINVKIFYGWRIVAAAASLQFLIAALLTQAFGAYVAVLADEFGWSKTALSAGAALQSIEGALLGPALGWLIDRFGPRMLIQSGLAVLSAGLAMLSQIETLSGFYGAVFLIAIGGSLCGYFPLTVTIVHWFQRRRARALSCMTMGLSAGGIALPLVGWAMQTYGWRATALGSALVLLVLGWPLTMTVRHTPAEMGETVDGEPPEAAGAPAAAPAAAVPAREFTAGQALRTRAFWLLGLGHSFALLVVTAVNVHAISHIKERMGYSVAQASFVVTMMMLAQMAGLLVAAARGDRWNKRYVAAACMLGHMGGLLMLAFAVNPLMLGLFALLHGVAWGIRGPFMLALRADYFGVQAIGLILGLSALLIASGQVAGPMVAGFFADLDGHYRNGFVILALVAGSGSALFMLAKKPM